MIPATVIKELIAIGRSDRLEDPQVFDVLGRDHDLDALNRVHWSEWGAATSDISEEDLVVLVRALTMMDNRYSGGGSVAGVVWVYQALEERNRERAHSLDDWISTRTCNYWADFGARRRWLAGAHARELTRRNEQEKEHSDAAARKLERAASAKSRSERGNAERATTIKELELLSPTERLACVAERASHPPHYFPEQWTDITDEDLLTFDATNLNALTLWLAPIRKGPWKRLYDRLVCAKDFNNEGGGQVT